MTRGGVLITGVSTGIGAAVLRELVAGGFRVFGTVRRSKDMPAVEAAGATPIIMDVTQRTSIQRAQETVARALDAAPFVGLVNNAGVPGAGALEVLDVDEFRRVFEVNVFGVIATTQLFLPALRAARGRVVNISSVAARLALPFSGPYTASKWALEAISDTLRRELLETGVDVVVVQPASIQSAIWEKIEGLEPARYERTVYERAIARATVMARRSGERGLPAETVARAVLRALTDPKPPTRILVTKEAAWKRKLLSLIPDRWIDRMIRRRIFGPDDGRGL